MIDNDREYGFCTYCGTKIMVQQEIININVTKNDSKQYNELIELSNKYYSAGSYEECAKIAEKAKSLNDSDPRSYWNIVRALVKLSCTDNRYPNKKSIQTIQGYYEKYKLLSTDRNDLESVFISLIPEMRKESETIDDKMERATSMAINGMLEEASDEFNRIEHEHHKYPFLSEREFAGIDELEKKIMEELKSVSNSLPENATLNELLRPLYKLCRCYRNTLIESIAIEIYLEEVIKRLRGQGLLSDRHVLAILRYAAMQFNCNRIGLIMNDVCPGIFKDDKVHQAYLASDLYIRFWEHGDKWPRYNEEDWNPDLMEETRETCISEFDRNYEFRTDIGYVVDWYGDLVKKDLGYIRRDIDKRETLSRDRLRDGLNMLTTYSMSDREYLYEYSRTESKKGEFDFDDDRWLEPKYISPSTSLWNLAVAFKNVIQMNFYEISQGSSKVASLKVYSDLMELEDESADGYGARAIIAFIEGDVKQSKMLIDKMRSSSKKIGPISEENVHTLINKIEKEMEYTIKIIIEQTEEAVKIESLIVDKRELKEQSYEKECVIELNKGRHELELVYQKPTLMKSMKKISKKVQFEVDSSIIIRIRIEKKGDIKVMIEN